MYIVRMCQRQHEMIGSEHRLECAINYKDNMHNESCIHKQQRTFSIEITYSNNTFKQ